MSIFRQIVRGMRPLLKRADADQDISDEVRDYVERAAADERSRGASQTDAWRAARIGVGNPTVVAEQIRSVGWENIVETLIGDIRFALRRLKNNPGFTIAAVATLGLGIGASTAIYSAVDPILFRPLPYARAEQLVTFIDRGADGGRLPVTFGTYRENEARNH